MEDFDKNTWIGGMDQDTSKSKFQDNKYYELRNAHFITQDGLSTGSIENEKGTDLILTLPTIPASTTLGNLNTTFSSQVAPKVIGWKFYRDSLIVFSTCSDGEDNIGHIWLIPIDITTAEPLTTISVSEHLKYIGNLPFNSEYRIKKVIPRYEYGDDISGGVFKIYFTNGHHNMWHLNLFDVDHFLSGTKIVDIPELSLDMQANVGSQSISPITFVKVKVGGVYKSGMVQYAYQVYNPYGVESKYIGYSKLIHITEYNEYESNTSNYFGSYKDKNCGKAIELTIPAIDTSLFSNIRVVSLFYDTISSTPTINVIYESTSTNQAITITDGGNISINILTLQELIGAGTTAFCPQDLEVKNNRLIAANISVDNTFEVANFDTRAYRFKSASDSINPRYCILYESDNSYIAFNGNQSEALLNVAFDNIPLTHSCINKYNEIIQGGDNYSDVFGKRSDIYQSNGTTIGGEGKNIKYEFVVNPIVIDEGNEVSGNLSTIRKLQAPLSSTTTSYTSYASPSIHGNSVGYMRDEIYSFAIQWIGSKGEESFVEWIGDIRTPRIYDIDDTIKGTEEGYVSFYDFRTSYKGVDGKNYANILGIKFTLKNVPTGVIGYRILRCERTDADRTILFQGLVEGTQYLSNFQDPNTRTSIVNESNYPTYDLYGIDKNYVNSIGINSPELSFFKTQYNYQTNDFIAFPAIYTNKFIKTRILDNSILEDQYIKFTSVEPYSSIGTTTPKQNDIAVNSGIVVGRQDIATIPNLVGSTKYINYVVSPRTIGSIGGMIYVIGSSNLTNGYKNTYGVFDMDTNVPYDTVNSTWTSYDVTRNTSHYLANYKRPLVPYKGNTYQARLQREYIPCSDIISIDTSNIIVYQGDTYISYFSMLRCITDKRLSPFDGSSDTNGYTSQQWIAFPVETRINLDLRSDELLNWLKREDAVNATVTSLSAYSGGNNYSIKLYQNSQKVEITHDLNIIIPIGTTLKLKLNTYKVIESHINGFTIDFPYPDPNIEISFDALTSPGLLSVGVYNNLNLWTLEETQENGLLTYPDSYPSDITDLYVYNSVYSKENDVIKGFPKPFNFKNITKFGTKIQASLKRILGSTSDQWLNFQVNTYNNVDSPYGDITALQVFKDNLFFFQNSGFGIQPIDERVTVPDETGNKMILGDGDVVGRYGYISRLTGCSNQASIVITEDQLHFFDIRLKRWNVYNGSLPLPLSSVKGLFSYFNNKINSYYTQLQDDRLTTSNPSGICASYDIRNNRILMSFIAQKSATSSENYSDTLSFNLNGNSFDQFIDMFPSLYCNVGNNLISINSASSRSNIYRHNTGTYGMYYDNTIPMNVVLKFVTNKYPDNTKIFTWLEFNSTIEKDGLEYFDELGNPEVLNIFRMLNDYQSTGFKKLRVMGTPNTTNVMPTTDLEVRRRFRTWRLKIPRSEQMKDGDKSDARIRSQYAFIEFIFQNNNNKRLVLHDVSVFFMKS